MTNVNVALYIISINSENKTLYNKITC